MDYRGYSNPQWYPVEDKSYNTDVFLDRDGLWIPQEGTKFRITSMKENGAFQALPIVPSPEQNKFFALFNEDDVDFQIEIDNSRSLSRDIVMDLGIHDELQGVFTGAGHKTSVETLISLGPKFHFLGSSHEEAQTYVGLYAKNNQMSYNEAAAILGRISFRNISYSMMKNPPRPFMIFVRIFDGRTIALYVEDHDSVQSVKEKIMKRTGILPCHQLLMHAGRVLYHNAVATLKDYGVTKDSNLMMNLTLFGGHPSLVTNYSPRREIPAEGESGVVVLGAKSGQIFQPYFGFKEDPSVWVNDFVVELRHQPSFTFW